MTVMHTRFMTLVAGDVSSPERDLAVSVIMQCVRDVKSSKVFNIDDFMFLTGKTEISVFWFDVAGLDPFSESSVISILGGGL